MHRWKHSTLLLLVAVMFAVSGCAGDDGKDGKNGKDGLDGADGGTSINASALSDENLEGLEVVSEITEVVVASPPEVTFTLKTSTGVPITGIVPFWENDSRYVRFTMTKLVPGTDGGPNAWVSYTRDSETNAPDYDTGSSLVDNEDGTYTFTFNTDVTAVDGVEWEPTLTHRVAGQIGSRSVPLEPQNLVYDYIPAGGEFTTTQNMTTMAVCNECHDDLVFHGRRFETEYCTQCHNPDLADGEGDMSFMIHRIHASGTFEVLDDAIDYSYVTYPQDLANCRKCHDATKLGTPDGDNWMNVPSIAACAGCHTDVSPNHGGGGGGQACLDCHDDGIAPSVETAHLTANATPNNPNLLPGQRSITYELVEATVDGSNDVTIKFKILSDGTALDMTNLPQDLADRGNWPSFLLAYAMPQDGIDEPMDYNNMGQRAAQPISVSIGNLVSGADGRISFDAGSGVNTGIITNPELQFPAMTTLRAVGLQGYFQQDLTGNGEDDVSLHTPSAVVAVTGDDVRRTVVDSASCASCHEWFEGHGGNRTYNIQICTLCHVPNQSSSGRTVTDPTDRGLDAALQAALDAGTLDMSVDPDDPTTYPEDAQNLKDLIHGIHAAGDRTRPYQHVRGGRQGYYDWEHVTFPRGASTANCKLCHISGTTDLPLAEGLLGTTVRTTGQMDGQDGTPEDAFVGLPNATDWINSPTASSCFYCHTSTDAMAHMMQNGGLLSDPSLPLGSNYSSRSLLGSSYESCAVCHGPGKAADVEAVHNK